MAKEVEAPFAALGLEFRTSIKTERPLPGRESHFYSLVKNFVNNARDAHQEAMAAGRPGPHWIEVEVSEADEHLVLIVADNATGISEENQQKMFEAFFTTKTQGRGVGLGLSVVSRLTTLYQGQLQVQSQLGAGTRFTLRFPFQRRPKTEVEA